MDEPVTAAHLLDAITASWRPVPSWLRMLATVDPAAAGEARRSMRAALDAMEAEEHDARA